MRQLIDRGDSTSNGVRLAHLCPSENPLIYFFSKQDQFLRCEIYPGQPHRLTLVDANGAEHTERHTTTQALEARWTDLRTQLLRDGWIGPFGRDARV